MTVFGNYFGAERLPSSTTVKSRQINPSATGTFNASSNPGTGGTRLIGTPLVSGLSNNGQSIADFFVYIGSKLFPDGGHTFDFTKAPNASTINLELWETSQKKLIDYGGKIAEGCNHLFRIKNKNITIIDRAETPESFITIQNKDIIKASYRVAYPIKAFQSNWKVQFANTTVSPARLDQKEVSIVINNSDSGKVQVLKNVTENVADQTAFLEAIKNILRKAVIDVTLGGVRTDLDVGNRIKFSRDEDSLTIDMIVRTIKFDVNSLQTSLSGEGAIVVLEKDNVY